MAIKMSYYDVLRVNKSVFVKDSIGSMKIKLGVFLAIMITNSTFKKCYGEFLRCDKSILIKAETGSFVLKIQSEVFYDIWITN